MRHVAVVEQVRQIVQRVFQELSIPTQSELEETILIRDGYYCGRRFATAGAHAIWFCEENQLKFYGENGTVMRVIQDLDRRVDLPSPPLADVA